MLDFVPLNSLPTVITGPGEYITRNGGRATIYAIKPFPDPAYIGFSAKGSVWRIFRGVFRPRGYDIWHVSGRGYPVKESGRDIVARWEVSNGISIPTR